MNIEQSLINKIKELSLPVIIGISGFGGSGKSSFAKILGEKIGAKVIEVDSFQSPDIFSDKQYSLWDIMNYAQLEKEVIQPFLNNGKEKMLIVEGVGLFRPELNKYFAYKIWIDCPIETATFRGKKRDREEYHTPQDEKWDGIWKKNDLQYYESFKPAEKADIIVSN